MSTRRHNWCLGSLVFSGILAFGVSGVMAQTQQPTPGTPGQEQPAGQNPPASNPGQTSPASQAPRELPPDSIRPNYVLAPADQILVRVNPPGSADEINDKPFRIDADGYINVPLLGRFHVAGMSVQELEADVVQKLREYVREPQVSIQVTQFHSAPVFFVGAFKAPGIYALQGNRSLVEMLTQIGGTLPNASQRIKITRRAEYGAIPLPNAMDDQEKKISSVEISLASLRQNVNPAEDILLQPYDVISVERAEQIYVTGEVSKTGGVELGERESISIAQVLTMSGGFTRDALRGRVRILRPIEGTTRRAAIEVNVKRIFEGKDNDIPLLPNDIVYVPRSYLRLIGTTTASLALSTFPYIIFLATQ